MKSITKYFVACILLFGIFLTAQHFSTEIYQHHLVAQAATTKTHTVVKGDTLFSISRKYVTTVAQLQKWNGMGTSTNIKIGQKLIVSAASTTDSATGKTVYLTFDDGPSQNTAKILDILKEQQVPGTFFVLGTSINSRSDSKALLNRIKNEGHYIGLHSMTHDKAILYQGTNAPTKFLAEMKELQTLVKNKTGYKTYLYRPPYGTVGNFTKAHITKMKASDFNAWDWNVDSNDWSATTTQQVLDNVKSGLKLRQNADVIVILFHEKDITVQALPKVIAHLKAEGYQFGVYDPNNHRQMNLIYEPGL